MRYDMRDVKESLTHKVTISCEKVLRLIGLILSDAICEMRYAGFALWVRNSFMSRLVSCLANKSKMLVRVNWPLRAVRMKNLETSSILVDR
jgi:hypothetical protein